MTLRPAEQLLQHAVAGTITALDLTDADAAAVKLACEYAEAIDNHPDHAWAMRWIGPLLLDVLESLGATPLARSRIRKGVVTDGKPSQLDQLRAARRR